jgi:hypothetical protein
MLSEESIIDVGSALVLVNQAGNFNREVAEQEQLRFGSLMRSPVKAGGELRSCALSIVTREVPDRGLGMKYCPTLPSGICRGIAES